MYDWRGLCVVHRAAWAGQRFEAFGHALLQQLEVAPCAGLIAPVLLAPDPLRLSAEDWAHKPFLPLPVLGIPGWWLANQDPAFYDDTRVFRPARLKAGAAP